MIIIKTKQYLKSYKKNILHKNLKREMNRISNIENLLINSSNLQDVMNSAYKNVYRIEQKQGDLKEYYTARVNDKVRLVMKPVGNYPYNLIEIDSLEFVEIDSKHYGEG